MSDFIPKVLIFGHSFVRRLDDDLVKECVSTVMLCIVIVYISPGKFIL